MDETTTLDGLLNRRVQLEQLRAGYRVAVDTVLLAAAVPAVAGERVLEFGCGVGGALLCVACRVKGISGLGIDIQAELVRIFARNIHRNDFAAEIEAREGDVATFAGDGFDQVMMNPPYHEETRHDVSANAIKRVANSEKDGDLGAWIATAGRALKDGSILTLIHRADRQEEILGLMRGAFGDAEILPLVPNPGRAAKRIIIRARKGAAGAPKLCKRLVLHKAEGGYTAEAERILREAQALVFQSP